KRMKAEEFLLRFLALRFDFENYEKPLAAFLNIFAERHRDADEAQLRVFTTAITSAISGIASIFGALAFKVFDRQDNDRILSHFNAALFDAEMLSISRSEVDVATLSQAKRTRIL